MDTATCLNNKLTDLINDGVREVDCYRPRQQMIVGSSAANMTRQTGREQDGGE